MSKAYIITKVEQTDTNEGKPQTIGIVFEKKEAEKVKRADMRKTRSLYSEESIFSYNEPGGYLVPRDDSSPAAINWNIEEVDIRIPLTPLQVSSLNLLALNIAGNPKSFADYENLSDEERAYLVDNLKKTYHIDINKEGK